MNLPINATGRLTGLFITSKLTPLITLATVLLGVFALVLTPREENPQIIVPAAEVSVTMPGASAEEMEQLIVTPLEGILSELSGVDHTYGIAVNSFGKVMVQFKVGENKEDALIALYDRIELERHRLPSEASAPFVQALDVDDVPIVTVTLASSVYDDYALKRLADRMTERLRSLEPVSVVEVYGGVDRQIRIEIDPDRLQAAGLALNHVRNILSASNISLPAGDIVAGGERETIEVSGFIDSAEALRRLIIGQSNGRPIYLSDIAAIIDGPPTEREALSRFAYGRASDRYELTSGTHLSAVTLGVAKKPGINAVVTADQVIDRIDRLKAEFIPRDIDVVITRNDGEKANDSVNTLVEHLAIAVGSVFLVLILFLGWKEATIVTATVPLAFALTFAGDLLFGISLNRVTLFALILSLGLLVDAAIVVIENIHRHYKDLDGKDRRDVTVFSVSEIGNPTNLATFAIMLVFLSLMSVTGMPGQYFYPVAFNVPLAMAASLLAAYIFTPWAAYLWLKPPATDPSKDENKSKKPKRPGLIHRSYIAVITPILDRSIVRLSVFVLVGVLFLISALQPSWQFMRPSGLAGPKPSIGVAMGFLPKDDKNTFNITVDMPQNTPLETTDQMAREIEKLLTVHEEIDNYQTWIGTAGPPDFNGLLRGATSRQGSFVAEIRVNLRNKHHRSLSSIAIVRELRPDIEQIQVSYPGSLVHLVEDPPGPPVRATVLAEIYGADLAVLRDISARVSEEFRATYDMVEVDESEPEDVRQRLVTVDREKAALSGIMAGEVARTLRALVAGETLGRVHFEGEKQIVPIVAHVPRRYQIDVDQLDGVFVENPMGLRVPLSELVTITSDFADRPILHKDNERVVFVGGELSRTAQFYAVLDLERRLNGMDLGEEGELQTGNLSLKPQRPDTISGYQLLWDGEMRLMLDTYRDMIRALGLAMIAVYLLLVAYYRSLVIPVIAMSAVPLGLIGIFPGHWIMGADFSATSMVGIIALAGVVVRNSLLIIDFVLDNLKQGMSLHDAVSEAGAVRLLPILLTTLAIVLGSAILISDPVFAGLGISLIFGSIVATILTLIVVPILLYLYLRPAHLPADDENQPEQLETSHA